MWAICSAWVRIVSVPPLLLPPLAPLPLPPPPPLLPHAVSARTAADARAPQRRPILALSISSPYDRPAPARGNRTRRRAGGRVGERRGGLRRAPREGRARRASSRPAG